MVSVRFIVLSLLIISGWTLSGCTRPEAETSTIKIVVPQAMKNLSKSAYSQSLSADEKLGHLVINASGEGIPFPIVKTIETHRELGQEAIQSPTIEMPIPIGSNRLIQVLAVYMGSSGSMSFYYGEVVKTLSGPTDDVVVPISSINSGPMVTGNVHGRYLTDANSGPSGVISMRFNPGTGKQPMIIDRSPILNGWFSTFMLSGVPLEYALEDGQVLWGGPVSLDDTRFKPAASAANVLRVTIPAHKRNESSSWQPNEASIHVYGWFSNNTAALSGKSICRDSLATLTKLSKFDNTANLLTAQLDQTLPTNTALVATDSSSLSSYYVNGGISSGSGACMGGNTVYNDFLHFKSAMIDGNGNDGAAPFQMPFKKVSDQVFNVVMNDPREIQAQVLPGLAPFFGGFKLFKKISSQDIHFENPDCGMISNPMSGFVPAGDGTLSAGSLSLVSNISAAEATSGVTAVLCPLRPSGEMYRMGVALSKWNFQSWGGGGGGGGMAGPPHHLVVRTQASVNTSFCTYVSVEVVDSNGFPTNTTNPISFNISGDGGKNAEIFASGSNCSAGPSSMGFTIPGGQSIISFQFKGGPSHPVMDHINISGITGTSIPVTMVNVSEPIAVVNASAITQIALDPGSRSRMNPNYCHPIVLRTVSSNMNPISVAGNTPFDLSVTSSSGMNPFQLYTDSGCATPLPAGPGNGMFASGTSQATYYIKATATGYGQIQATFNQNYVIASVPTDIPSTLNFHLESVAAGNETHLVLSAPYSGSDANSGNCLPLNVQVFDDSLAPVAVTGDLFMNGPFSGSVTTQFYSDSNCTALISGGSSVPLSAQSSKTVYFRPNVPYSASVETLQMQASFSTGVGSNFRQVQGQIGTGINPVKIVPQVLLGGVPQGMPFSTGPGVCVEVRLLLKQFAGPSANNLSGSMMNIPINFTTSFVGDGELHNNSTCTNVISPPLNFVIGSGNSISTSYWIKNTAGTGNAYTFAMPGLPLGVQWLTPGTMFTLDP